MVQLPFFNKDQYLCLAAGSSPEWRPPPQDKSDSGPSLWKHPWPYPQGWEACAGGRCNICRHPGRAGGGEEERNAVGRGPWVREDDPAEVCMWLPLWPSECSIHNSSYIVCLHTSRDIVKSLADVFRNSVIVVDTSNEIAGVWTSVDRN